MSTKRILKGHSFYLPDLGPETIFVVTSGDEAAYRGKQPEGATIKDLLPALIELAPARPTGNYIPDKRWEPLNDKRFIVLRETLTDCYPYAPHILPESCPPGKRAKQPHNHDYCLAQEGTARAE